jgi:hypothetical protein
MTREWYLSSDLSKSLGILSVCADALFAIEQNNLTPKERTLSDQQILDHIKTGMALLLKLKEAAMSQIEKDAKVDSFLFFAIDGLKESLGLNNKALIKRIYTAENDLKNMKLSPETEELFKNLCQVTKRLTTQTTEALMKPSI